MQWYYRSHVSKRSTKAGDGDLEKKRWYKNTKAWLALAAAIGGLIASLIAWSTGLITLFEPEPVHVNKVIVLDRSEGMASEFDGGTKLQAAIQMVHSVIEEESASRDNLALRIFGGPCGERNTKLAVKFGQNNAKSLQAALSRLSPQGEASLSHAVIEATADFNDHRRFDKMNKQIVVITGSYDTCFVGDALAAIRHRIDDFRKAGFEIGVDFRFIALGVTAAQKTMVSKLAEDIGGRAYFVDHLEDFKGILRRVVWEDPMCELLARVEMHLNRATEAVHRRQYSDAEESLRGAKQESARSASQLANWEESRQQSERLRAMHGGTSSDLQILDQLISLAESMYANAQSGNNAGYEGARKEFDAVADKFNNAIKQFPECAEAVLGPAK